MEPGPGEDASPNQRKQLILRKLNLELSDRRTTPKGADSRIPVRLHPIGATKAARGSPLSVDRRRLGVDIRNYRPGYEWNRGGRIKELRIRYLARKYFRLWKGRVYGRCEPAIARQLYRRRLLARCFLALKEEWWTQRQEWKLTVRAEVHHRYQVYQGVWRAWTCYANERGRRTERCQLAVKHYGSQLASRVLSAWHIWTHHGRQKRADSVLARQHFVVAIERRCFWKWKMAFEVKQSLKVSEALADQVNILWLQRTAWNRWRCALERRRRFKAMLDLAADHFATSNMQRLFRAWRRYNRYRRWKRREKALADGFHRDKLLLRHFDLWIQRGDAKKRAAALEEHVASLADKNRSRRALRTWKSFVLLRRRKRQVVATSEAHFDRSLKTRALLVFARNAALQQKKHSEEHHYQTVITWAFAAWRQFVERQHAKRDREQMADHHFRQQCCSKVVAAWRQHVLQRRDIHHQADSMARSRHRQLSRTYLHLWRSNVALIRAEDRNERVARQHRSRLVLAKCFKSWKVYATVKVVEHRQQHEMVEHVRLQLAPLTLRSFFLRWHSATRKSVHERDTELRAERHSARKLKRMAVARWKRLVKLQLRKTLLGRHGQLFSARRVTALCFRRWKHVLSEAQAQRQGGNMAAYHWALGLQRRVFTGWKEYAVQRARRKELVALAYDVYRKRLLRQGVCTLLRFLNHREQMRTNSALSKSALHLAAVIRLAHKYVGKWKDFVQQRRATRVQVASALSPRWSPTKMGIEFDPRLSMEARLRPAPRQPSFLRDSLQRDGLLDFPEECSSSPSPDLEEALIPSAPDVPEELPEAHSSGTPRLRASPLLLPPSAFESTHQDELEADSVHELVVLRDKLVRIAAMKKQIRQLRQHMEVAFDEQLAQEAEELEEAIAVEKELCQLLLSRLPVAT